MSEINAGILLANAGPPHLRFGDDQGIILDVELTEDQARRIAAVMAKTK